jgi:DNA-binding SARP family transcriptional activator/TolB-like protein
MLHLKTFGGLSVDIDGTPGTGAAQQRKTLALLALVAAAGSRGLSRDKLIVSLWPETDTAHGRGLLKQACYALRRDLDAPELFLGSIQLRLNPAVISSDVESFARALEEHDPIRAVACYTAPFLDGFYLNGGGEFEDWAETERARLASQCRGALEALSTEASRRGAHRVAAGWWRRLLEFDPMSSHAVLGLMTALDHAGERAEALRRGQAYGELVRSELGADPPAELSEWIEQHRHVAGNGVDRAVTRALAPVVADGFGSPVDLSRSLVLTVTPSDAATVSETSGVSPRPLSRDTHSSRWRMPLAVGVLGLGFLLGLGVLFAWRRHHAGVGEARRTKVLAVLPFESLGDSADAYFADGVANDVRTKLSQIAGMEVIARISSNEYRHTTKTTQQIVRELGVDYLLTATVEWEKIPGRASRVRVTPELVDVGPNHAPRSRWGQQFDAALTDVFQVQADIATRVAEALNVALGAKQQQVIAQQPTANLTAYNAFLKGDAAVERAWYQENDYRKAREALHFYEEAVALDPTFVNAWVELALWYSGLASSGQLPTDSSKARRAVAHAVALAPERPDVQLALGRYTQMVRRDPVQARAHYEAGLKVDPGNARLLLSMSRLETELGRLDEAVTYGLPAQALDPRSERATHALAEALHLLRRYPEALRAYEHARALRPMNLATIEEQAMVHLAQGDLTGARAVLASAAKDVDSMELARRVAGTWDLVWLPLSAQQDWLLQQLRQKQQPGELFDEESALEGILHAQIYYLRGDHSRTRAFADSARRGFDAMLRARPYLERSDNYVLRGLAWAYLGEKAQAMRDGERGLRRAFEIGDPWDTGYIRSMLARIYIVVNEPEKAVDQVEVLLKTPSYFAPGWFRVDPNFAPLRGDSRFERLVVRP